MPWKESPKLSSYLETFRQDVDYDLGSRPGNELAGKGLKCKLCHLDALCTSRVLFVVVVFWLTPSLSVYLSASLSLSHLGFSLSGAEGGKGAQGWPQGLGVLEGRQSFTAGRVDVVVVLERLWM